MVSLTVAACLLLLINSGTCGPAPRAASGCGASSPPFEVGKFSDNLTISTPKDGNRRYRVFLPQSYKQSQETPVILSFHGAGRTIERQRKLDGLTEGFRNDKYIVVYLQGLVPSGPNSSGKTAWQVDPTATADDLRYTAAVLDEVESKLCVKKSQVYATGKSQGGGMVNLLACDQTLSSRIAAFAPISGAYYIHDTPKAQCEPTDKVKLPTCTPNRKNIPLLAFHGGADKTIPFDGEFREKTNSCLPSIPHWVHEWVARDGLDVASGKTTAIQGSVRGNTTVWGGDAGLVTLVYDGDNIPHDWPSTVTNDDNKGKNLAAFNATDMILEWFDRFTRRSP